MTDGIKTAIQQILSQVERSIPDVRRGISHVSIGTTHFVNAVIEGDAGRLSRVAVVRLCGEYTRSVRMSEVLCVCVQNRT